MGEAVEGPGDLIPRLASDLRPAPPDRLRRRLAGAAGVGLLLTLLSLGCVKGFRPGAFEPALAVALVLKAAYACALAAPALWAAARLARPDGDDKAPLAWLLAPVCLLAALALTAWLSAAPADRGGLLLGHSALVCPAWIAAAALPALGGLMLAMREAAPIRPARTGAYLGLAAGAMGAGAYALFCQETSVVFIALWYSLGVVAAGVVGAVCGAWLLRW